MTSSSYTPKKLLDTEYALVYQATLAAMNFDCIHPLQSVKATVISSG
jgi:hypothetical protein